MSQKRSVTQGQLGQVEKIWREAGGNSKLFQEQVVDSQMLSRIFADIVADSKRDWREENGVIYFSVTSDGTTGDGWIPRLEAKTGKPAGTYAKTVLRSSKFKPTKGVTYHVAVLKGELYSDNERITSNIRSDAKRRKFSTPNAEIQCLIRMKFTDEEITAMGLSWIITMHEPIEDSGGDLRVLGSGVGGDSCVRAYGGDADRGWVSGNGFAFVVSQVGA